MRSIHFVFAALAACHASSPPSSTEVDAPAGSDVAGIRAISYTGPDGSTDREWIYVAAGPPGAPIVVISHGQGTEHVVNCWPDETPHDGTVQQAATLADAIAAEGFTAVAIAYRNEGPGQPRLPAMRIRDTYLRDAAAVLAAARDVRDRRGDAADTPVAFVGHSNGTYAAWWAATDRSELADLQRGLAIRSIVLAGHTANALANLVAIRPALTGDKSQRQLAVVATTLLAVGAAVQSAGVAELDAANLDDGSPVATRLASLVTPAGIAAFRAAFVTAVPSATAPCRAGVPAVCDSGCLANVLAAGPDPGAITDYTTQTTIDAIDAWDPNVFAVPTGTNPIVSVGRDISPPFYPGRVNAPRALVLYSANDHVIVPHGQATRDGTLAALRAQGASVPASSAIATDAKGVCEHGDYLDPARGCGFADIIGELHAALDATRP